MKVGNTRSLKLAWAQSKSSGNNFDALRLLAATFVLVSHSFQLTAQPSSKTPDWMHAENIEFGDVGLIIFFVISGYLITKSWRKDPDIMRFVIRRGLRIMPALIFVVIVSVFILGPFLTNLSVPEYFQSGDTYAYLQNIHFNYFHSDLPGVFAENPVANIFNAPLWTLAFEVFCYSIILVAGAARILNGRFCLVFLIAFLLIFILITPDGTASWYYTMNKFRMLGVPFLIGAAFSFYDKETVLDIRLAIFCIGAVIIGALIGADFGVMATFGAYVILFLAFAPLGAVARIGRRGDFSYGIYLWGWPIQQILVSVWPSMNWASNLILAFLMSLGIAALSWRFIEKPALALKPIRVKPA